MCCLFPLFTLFLRYQKFFTLKENYVCRSCNYDRLILSWLTYYFRSNTIVSIVYCKYSAPSRQNLDVLLRFRIFLAATFVSVIIIIIITSSLLGHSWPYHATHRDPTTKRGGRLKGILCLYRVGRCWWLHCDCLFTDWKWTITWWGKKN